MLPYHIHPSSTPKEQEYPLGCAGVTIAEVGGEGLLHQAGWRSCHFEFWGCSHAARILGLIPVLHVFLPLAHANMECSELGVEVPHSWLSQRDAWPFVLPRLRSGGPSPRSSQFPFWPVSNSQVAIKYCLASLCSACTYSRIATQGTCWGRMNDRPKRAPSMPRLPDT